MKTFAKSAFTYFRACYRSIVSILYPSHWLAVACMKLAERAQPSESKDPEFKRLCLDRGDDFIKIGTWNKTATFSQEILDC